MSTDSRIRRLARWLGWTLLVFVGVTVAAVAVLRWVDPPTTAFMLRHRLLADQREGWTAPRQQWVDWERISPWMPLAVVASEDQKFPHHFGFDVESIVNAIQEHRRQEEPLRGASTITQQVAKNLFLWPAHSFIRKGIEAWFALLIEALWSKQRILEVYLNIAQFGPNIYGVGAASQAFFNKSASELSRYEAALLAAVLPNPHRLRVAAPSDYVRERQRWIVGQMRGLGGPGYLSGL